LEVWHHEKNHVAQVSFCHGCGVDSLLTFAMPINASEFLGCFINLKDIQVQLEELIKNLFTFWDVCDVLREVVWSSEKDSCHDSKIALASSCFSTDSTPSVFIAFESFLEVSDEVKDRILLFRIMFIEFFKVVFESPAMMGSNLHFFVLASNYILIGKFCSCGHSESSYFCRCSDQHESRLLPSCILDHLISFCSWCCLLALYPSFLHVTFGTLGLSSSSSFSRIAKSCSMFIL